MERLMHAGRVTLRIEPNLIAGVSQLLDNWPDSFSIGLGAFYEDIEFGLRARFDIGKRAILSEVLNLCEDLLPETAGGRIIAVLFCLVGVQVPAVQSLTEPLALVFLDEFPQGL